LLWAAAGRLQGDVRTVIERDATEVLVSAVTVWEIEIKRALHRIRAPDDVARLVDESGFHRLSITFEHAREAGRLPLHHGDPFDRMLIAQARVEGLVLATRDERIRPYEVPTLAVGDG
jgi:PIN domain nuclease of toxin-antitoxin system